MDSKDSHATVTHYRELEKAKQEATWFGERFTKFNETSVRREVPPFPRYLMVEVVNICNHRCIFCAYPTMERPRAAIDPALYERVVREAYELGAREIGLHTGAEPLACKNLEQHIAYAKSRGYEYVFITSNGTLADEARWKRLVDAGLDSVKLSINGGDRETYRQVHGKDDFEKVLASVRFLSEYRKTLDRPLKLLASFVEVKENSHTFKGLVSLIGDLVDDILLSPAVNLSGQVMELPPDPMVECNLPFNRVHITREGYVRVCCNDYENLLAVEDLDKVSLKAAWESATFRSIRRKHIDGNLKGTLCHNCMTGECAEVRPLDPRFSAIPGKPAGTGSR